MLVMKGIYGVVEPLDGPVNIRDAPNGTVIGQLTGIDAVFAPEEDFVQAGRHRWQRFHYPDGREWGWMATGFYRFDADPVQPDFTESIELNPEQMERLLENLSEKILSEISMEQVLDRYLASNSDALAEYTRQFLLKNPQFMLTHLPSFLDEGDDIPGPLATATRGILLYIAALLRNWAEQRRQRPDLMMRLLISSVDFMADLVLVDTGYKQAKELPEEFEWETNLVLDDQVDLWERND